MILLATLSARAIRSLFGWNEDNSPQPASQFLRARMTPGNAFSPSSGNCVALDANGFANRSLSLHDGTAMDARPLGPHRLALRVPRGVSRNPGQATIDLARTGNDNLAAHAGQTVPRHRAAIVRSGGHHYDGSAGRAAMKPMPAADTVGLHGMSGKSSKAHH